MFAQRWQEKRLSYQAGQLVWGAVPTVLRNPTFLLEAKGSFWRVLSKEVAESEGVSRRAPQWQQGRWI